VPHTPSIRLKKSNKKPPLKINDRSIDNLLRRGREVE